MSTTKSQSHGNHSTGAAVDASTIARALACGRPGCACGHAPGPKGSRKTHCPAHNDRDPSLSLDDGDDGKVLLKCHGGCSQEAVIDALRKRGLWGKANGPRPAAEPRIVAVYDYTDEPGNVLFQVVRYDPKGFAQRRPDGKGGYIWGLQGVRRVLYHLPEVVGAGKSGQSILVVEGEKDVESLRKLGQVATTNPGGAGKWKPEYSDAMKGAHVAIIPDNDEPGRKHARHVAETLHGKAASVKLLELPPIGGEAKKDITDWLRGGGDIARLKESVDKAPQYRPSEKPAPELPLKGMAFERHETDPPFFLVRADEKRQIKLAPAELMSYASFRRKAFEAWNCLLPQKGQQEWETVLISCLPEIPVEEHYENGSFAGEVLDLLETWIREHRAFRGRDLFHFPDVKDGHVFFNLKAFERYVFGSKDCRFYYQRHLLPRATVIAILRSVGGFPCRYKKGRIQIRAWCVPADFNAPGEKAGEVVEIPEVEDTGDTPKNSVGDSP
ncbi:MAG: hypothetical protein HY673_00530 [Chloroflexi bacterium]|nr:hypothetical protein [Chloroflexota bacterium]